MTQGKKSQINKVIDNLKESRLLLGDVMFGDEGVSDEEFFRLRSCFGMYS